MRRRRRVGRRRRRQHLTVPSAQRRLFDTAAAGRAGRHHLRPVAHPSLLYQEAVVVFTAAPADDPRVPLLEGSGPSSRGTGRGRQFCPPLDPDVFRVPRRRRLHRHQIAFHLTEILLQSGPRVLLDKSLDDAPDGLFVFDLRVDDETRLAVAGSHQTPVAADGERFGVGNSAVGGLDVDGVEIARPAGLRQRLTLDGPRALDANVVVQRDGESHRAEFGGRIGFRFLPRVDFQVGALARRLDEIDVEGRVGEEVGDRHGHGHVDHFAALVRKRALDRLVAHVALVFFRLGRVAVRRRHVRDAANDHRRVRHADSSRADDYAASAASATGS